MKLFGKLENDIPSVVYNCYDKKTLNICAKYSFLTF